MVSGAKLKVFLGSSTESKDALDELKKALGSEFQLSIWHMNVFDPGENTYQELISKISMCDFAIFVLSADDRLNSRKKKYFAPRDNIIFEAGISFGILDPQRTFLMPERIVNLKMPSDMFGFVICDAYDRTNMKADIRKSTLKLKDLMRRIGRRRGLIVGEDKGELIVRTREILNGATRSINMVGRDISWIDDYKKELQAAIRRNVNIRIFGEYPTSVEWKRRLDEIKSMSIKVYCSKSDLGFRFTVVDREEFTSSEFILCSKERIGGRSVYKFEQNNCVTAPALWNTLNRLLSVYPDLSGPY